MIKKTFSLLVLTTSFQLCLAQVNLVPNPSFENLSGCPLPAVDNQIILAIPWFTALRTPDIWNTCAGSGSGIYGVPLNAEDCFQHPRTGNGYAGIITYFTIPRTTEYIEVKLAEKLKKGQQYYISFYVSPRNCAGNRECYADAMGLAFSDTLYHEEVIPGAEQIPPFLPAIQNPSGNILKDTLNWIQISGCYTATGTEQYAIIGGFRSSAATNSENCVGVTGSYHFIDDVSIYELDAFLPDTLLLCNGEAKQIGGTFLDGIYQWNTGETDSTINVSEEGEYIYNVTIGNCTLSDTVVVLNLAKSLAYLPADTLLCEGDTYHLDIPIKGIYEWSDGQNSNQVSISTPGLYTLSITNECGLYTHTFDVESEICDCNVFVPNVFSPNHDGINDYLECFIGCDFSYTSGRFQVFNRWGALVYSSHTGNNEDIRWDGSFKGGVLGNGVCFWTFEYEYTRYGKVNKKLISGSVTILK